MLIFAKPLRSYAIYKLYDRGIIGIAQDFEKRIFHKMENLSHE